MPFATSKDGTRIAWEAIGSGPPLILVDGAMCYRDSGPMRPLAEALAGSFTVILYDRRGRGESGDTPPYAPEREVEDIAALIEQAAGGEAFVYGCSSGGALALEAANRLDGVRRLIVYEAPFIVDGTHTPAPADEGERLQALVDAGQRGAAVKRFMRFVGVPGFMVLLMPLLMGKAWRKLAGVAHTLPYDYAIVGPLQRGQPLPAGRWRGISVPVLVADGGKSPMWMRNAQAALGKALGAVYRTLPGQTHMVKADVQAPMVRDFLLEAGDADVSHRAA
jgi:pimeloyl-ACP methyl ester carboxylesterase